jgi:hypothetical protein
MNDASNSTPMPIAPDGSSPSSLNPGRAKSSGALHPGDVRTLDDSLESSASAEEDAQAGTQRSPADVGSTYGGLRHVADDPMKRQQR